MVGKLGSIGAVLVLAWLGGCARPSSPKPVVLRVASWGGAGDDSEAMRIEQEVIAEFERRHPGVKIQQERTPDPQDYVRKLLLSFVAHSAPDVIRLDASSAAVFIDNGVLQNLSPYVEGPNGVDLEEFFPNVVDIGKRGQGIYAIPVDFTPLVVYYNRRLFGRAGVSYPEPNWTWHDFLVKARKLTTPDQHGYVFANWMPGWLPWVWNNGGDVFGPEGRARGSLDSDPTIQAVSWLRDLIHVERVAPSLSDVAAQGVDPFANGKAAMETSGHWRLVTFASSPNISLDEIGVAPLPTSGGQQPVTVIYESGWSIGRGCEHPDLAWEFIRYFTSYEVQTKIQRTGIGICARKDVARERSVNKREQKFLEIVPSGRAPWGARVQGYDFVESQGQRAMESVIKSRRDPREVFQNLARQIDRELSDR